MRDVLSGVLLLPLVLAPLAAQDYEVLPHPPSLVRDAATTFLVDFTGGRETVVHAGGNSELRGELTPTAERDGISGAFTIAGADNFDPASWTMELLLRLPADVAKADVRPLPGGFRSDAVSLTLFLHGGTGPGYRLHLPRSARGLPLDFLAAGGGNGWEISRDAPGRWIYIALGLDVKTRRMAAITRELDGDLLARSMQYAGGGGLHPETFGRLPPEDRPAAVALAFEELAAALAGGPVPELTLGHAAVDLAKVRLSKGFRDDVLTLRPAPLPYVLPRDRGPARTAAELDAPRAMTRRAERQLGYEGHNNTRLGTIDETYLPLAPGEAFDMPLPGLQPGLYTLYLYGTVARNGRDKLERVWQPAALEFEAKGPDGKVVSPGRLLLKQGFAPQRLQGFHVHADAPGDYVATFRLSASAKETAEILAVQVVDQLAGLPEGVLKTAQQLEPKGMTGQLTELTPERMARDVAIWNALPPLNVHLQVHGQVAAFARTPDGVEMPAWNFQAWEGLPGYSRIQNLFTPLDIVNPATGEVVLAHGDLLAGKPLRDGPWLDDGTGIFFGKAEHPQLAHDIHPSPLANLLGERVRYFVGLLGAWDHRGASMVGGYSEKGDAQAGHDAAMALARLAYDWPALEMNLHEHRLSTHSPDFEFNTDWSSGRNGKYFYNGWSGTMAVDFLTAYDRLFPYIQGNPVFADAVNRFIPWVRTPEDVVAFLDRWLVAASVRDYERGLITAAPVMQFAGTVLGPNPRIARWFDLTQVPVVIYPMQGSFQELYGSAMPRNGAYYIGSFMVYAFGAAADLVKQAEMVRQNKENGIPQTMDLSDTARYRKVRTAADFVLDIFTAGGMPLTVGDASGSTHTGLEADKRFRMLRATSEAATRLWGHPRHAWLMHHLWGDTSPEVAAAAAEAKDPRVHQVSRVVPNEMAVVEHGSDSTVRAEKAALAMRLGIGQGHAHADQLDLNLYGLGLPLAVDLACRNEGGNWSRPGAAWAFLHNRALSSDDQNPARAGGRTGEPWLRAFEPPLLRGSYVGADGKDRLERDSILMVQDDASALYVFDLQRLGGGKFHTWCFHGAESETVELNTPMHPAEEPPWLSRFLENTRFQGRAGDTLQATWTMTREGREWPHGFSGGGVVRTVGAEPHSLGPEYDAGKPPVRVRATLLGQGGGEVLQGHAYSQSYAYCFPFLHVQHPAPADGGETVYPAVYEGYRGPEPLVVRAELVSQQPLTVRVTTRSGQTDTFVREGEALSVVSQDAHGLRFALLSGGTTLTAGDLTITAAAAKVSATITTMDYARGELTTSAPLPPNPFVVLGNPGRWSNLQLTGSGTTFGYQDDLLIGEGKVIHVTVTDADTVTIRSGTPVLYAGAGNRRIEGMTQSTEDGSWLFRGGKVIRRPAGATLSPTVFTDANGDGFTHVKTYEAGVGDVIEVLAAVQMRRRAAGGYEVKTNVPATVTLAGRSAPFPAAAEWQPLGHVQR